MQYIVFGAGESGKKAAIDLGVERVEYFASNHHLSDDGKSQWIYDRKVISFDEMICRSASGDYIIVVASERYSIEMDTQLKNEGVEKYFVYHEFDASELWKLYPNYYLYRGLYTLNYAKILSLYKIGSYSRIAIYGTNYFLPYLISEISIQNSYKNIIGVIPENCNTSDCRSVGVTVCTLEELWNDIDCLVVNTKYNQSDIRSKLDIHEHDFDVVDIYDVDKFEPEYIHCDLARYKNIYKGKRVFVIGNGPSLTSDDLDILSKNKEICFGANSIYKIFNRTDWKPDYLCYIDPVMINSSAEEITKFRGEVFVADIYHRYGGVCIPDSSNVHTIHQVADITDLYYPNKPSFSSDITKSVYTSFSVTYFSIQIAAYMVAKEIYLLGVDNTIGKNYLSTKHFSNDYLNEAKNDSMIERLKDIDMSKNVAMINNGYLKAEEYSRAHGFRVFNATRGGMLEVFERVNFDSLFLK